MKRKILWTIGGLALIGIAICVYRLSLPPYKAPQPMAAVPEPHVDCEQPNMISMIHSIYILQYGYDNDKRLKVCVSQSFVNLPLETQDKKLVVFLDYYEADSFAVCDGKREGLYSVEDGIVWE